jgi:cell wall-associated NlpC family hydrolase
MIKTSDFLGKAYQSGGRGPEVYDCWGLVMAAMKQTGTDLPDYGVNPDDTNAVAVLAAIEKYSSAWEQYPPDYVQAATIPAGLVVAFQLKRPGDITHAGVTLGHGNFIHCIQKKGVCVEPLARYQKLIEGIYEFTDKK